MAPPQSKLLFVHNGDPMDRYVDYLRSVGFLVESSGHVTALGHAIRLQPHVIVLDFAVNGGLVEALKSHRETQGIPVIALAEISALR
jgi:hypothetical protein